MLKNNNKKKRSTTEEAQKKKKKKKKIKKKKKKVINERTSATFCVISHKSTEVPLLIDTTILALFLWPKVT